MTAGDLVLGIDAGTSSLKAALFDMNGHMHASSRAAYPTYFPAPGHAEQDPADWWGALKAATHEIVREAPQLRARIGAIGIAAQMCGTIPVDRDGNPLHRCLTWIDTRSAPVARAITRGGPRIAGYGVFRLAGWLRLANGAPNLSGKDPLSKILWFREARDDIWRSAACFVDAKDWLIHRCTGEFATTPDVAQMTWLMDNGIGRRNWSDKYLARFGISRERLPRITEADAIVGTLTPRAADELGLPRDLPVSGGTGDVSAGALAAGDAREGAYHVSLGTSMCLAAPSMRRRVRPFAAIGTLCAAQRDRYLLVATQESAGSAICWAAQALGFGDGPAGAEALEDAASTAEPGTDTPHFLPWLWGERVPTDDRHLRGGFAGASLRTTRADLAYSVLAGVALNARWALDEATRCLPAREVAVRVLGGGAESVVLVQVLADMLQRPLVRLEHPSYGGARGAAMTGAVAAGWLKDLDSASTMCRLAHRVEPQRQTRAWADDRYGELVGYWRATRRWHAQRAAD